MTWAGRVNADGQDRRCAMWWIVGGAWVVAGAVFAFGSFCGRRAERAELGALRRWDGQ